MRAVLLTFFLLFALPAVAQSEAAQVAAAVPEVRLSDNQVLLPGEGPAWRLIDKTSGEEKQIILPAFHPELSYPVVKGKRLAYVGRTQNKGKQQLGCITFDLARGKVLNRQVSSLFAREGQVIASPELSETENAVVCHLAGDRCSGKTLDACTPATETISLDFEPGSLARKDLKSAKSGKATRSAKAAKGGRKTVSGKGASGKGVKKSAAAGKVAGKAGRPAKAAAKPSAKPAPHAAPNANKKAARP